MMHRGAYVQGFIVWVCPRLSDRRAAYVIVTTPVEGHVISGETLSTKKGKREGERGYTTYRPDEGMGRAGSTRTDVRTCKRKGEPQADGICAWANGTFMGRSLGTCGRDRMGRRAVLHA
jgi:hypothetical protein